MSSLYMGENMRDLDGREWSGFLLAFCVIITV